MNKTDTSKIFFMFFGILSWLSAMILFILPTLPPYQDYIKTQGGMATGWIILLLVFITLFYIAILILDIYSPVATQVVQFVLLTVVVVCAVPSITAFILASFVINISIIEILASMLHILWFAIPFMQNKESRDNTKAKINPFK
ncbi:hypothetical protein [Staphylococcus shinii]|uniref:hypothetical protein n=1 Tax=Staphylococcus shinii TaxID=2912228 RepID=UPI003F84BED1